jgi:tetratricopeptide (TPR) repeat protein
MTQVFAIQSDVAQRIAAALQAKLSPSERGRIEKKQTDNTEAYRLYLKGRFYWNKRRIDDIKTAIEYFKQAIEKDPGYAQAYAGLASTYVLIPQYGMQSMEWYAKADSAARKALEIDATLAEAYTVLGLIANDHEYDWAGAEKYFRRAIELDPGYPTAHQWYSSTLQYLGRLDEALAEVKRAHELDPLSLVISMNLGDVLYLMRQYDRAIEQYKSTLALDQDFAWARYDMAWAYAMEGKLDEAIAECKRAQKISGDMPVGLSELGRLYARAGRKSDALRVLDELLRLSQRGYRVPSGIGALYFELGDRDKAFEWLEKAYQSRDVDLIYLGVDPMVDDIRSDPRGVALLKKMGLAR